MRISDWSSDVCSSDLFARARPRRARDARPPGAVAGVERQRERPHRPLSCPSGRGYPRRSGACPHTDLRAAARRRTRVFAAERSRSEEHTSELKSLIRISYAVFILKNKKITYTTH